jgi:hypothetical protein
MKLFFSLLYQELVCDGRMDSRNAWDQVICSCYLNFLLCQDLVCNGWVDCKNARDEVICSFGLNFLLYLELVCDGNVRDEVICSCDLNFLLNQELVVTVAWIVRMPGMKLFVLVSLIFCCVRSWFAMVAWTVRMPGIKLNFLLYQELVYDGRVDCRNARDEAIFSAVGGIGLRL